MEHEIDYQALFYVTPSPFLVLTPDLIIADVNAAYLQATGRDRDDLLGQYVFDAFPDNPADPAADGMRNLSASLNRVLETGERDIVAPHKYDIPVVAEPGTFEERYWSTINTPVLGPDGSVSMISHRVEDVTAFVRARGYDRADRGAANGPGTRESEMESELYARAKELQVLNARLRQAHERERAVGLALQQALLPGLASHLPAPVAVRYQPAVGSLNVCGDWYDVVDLGEKRLAVAVGDVVGHGLAAACVMGQLRSALSAAIRAVDGPGRALDVLGGYAGHLEGALATTAVQVVIDCATHTIDYSRAGHLPPVLLSPDGTARFLDEVVDPPLGAEIGGRAHCQARATYEEGARLVLYTDGLIERRDDDIDAGLGRLVGSLTRRHRLSVEPLAEALVSDLVILGGGTDDVALVVIGL